jgi:hypothetical protein
MHGAVSSLLKGCSITIAWFYGRFCAAVLSGISGLPVDFFEIRHEVLRDWLQKGFLQERSGTGC